MLIVPIGWITPFTNSTARVKSSAGVRNLPIMSITALGLTVSMNTAPKKSAPKSHGLHSGNSGSTPISNVVAQVRGMQSSGPTHSMATVAITAAAGLESRLSILHTVPS